MYSTVQTAERPISVYQTHDERDAIRLPTGVVDERCEYKFRMLMRRCRCRHRDENDEKRNEGDIESSGGYDGDAAAIAVEQETERVHHLVGDKGVPGFHNEICV